VAAIPPLQWKGPLPDVTAPLSRDRPASRVARRAASAASCRAAQPHHERLLVDGLHAADRVSRVSDAPSGAKNVVNGLDVRRQRALQAVTASCRLDRRTRLVLRGAQVEGIETARIRDLPTLSQAGTGRRGRIERVSPSKSRPDGREVGSLISAGSSVWRLRPRSTGDARRDSYRWRGGG